jgi:hypothetical protein
MSDLPLIGSQSAVERSLLTNPAQVRLDLLPPVKELRTLDLNQDLQLNDFDVKQFESIIDTLNGRRLSGLQLSTRFRTEQKNQHDSFPILYDLNRDGLFTEYDVDYFTRLIDELDEGKNSGGELAEKFRMRVFPLPSKEIRNSK